jgi:hypothetical protein
MGTANAFPVIFGTNDTERMRIDSSGDMIMKGGRIKVRESDDGNDAVVITRDADEGYVNLYSEGSQTIEIRGNGNSYFNGGNVGIGTSSPSEKLEIAGAASATSTGIAIKNGSATRLRIFHNDNAGTNYISSHDVGAAQALFIMSGNNLLLSGGGGTEPSNGEGLCIGSGSTITRIDMRNTTTGDATGDGTSLQLNGNDFTIENREAGYVAISTSLTERMRIDSSGNLLVGTTNDAGTNAEGFLFYAGSGASRFYIGHVNGTANGTQYTVFNYNSTKIGDITQSGTTAVLYNTTSDERLKENITDANDAGDKIDAIKVRQYDWKADGSHQDYGMIAQELQLVAPEAVSGDADSEEMMGVDYSKLVPMLIKEIQSLRNRVAQLEA